MTAPITESEIRDDLRRAKRQLFVSAVVLLLGSGMWSLSSSMNDGSLREVLLTTGIALATFGLAGVVAFSVVTSLFAAAHYHYRRETRGDDGHTEEDEPGT